MREGISLEMLAVKQSESESPSNNMERKLPFSDPKWLERDESVALWVKWGGKWQAGIRCARADWPLSTLKARPTHDRKQYFFFLTPGFILGLTCYLSDPLMSSLSLLHIGVIKFGLKKMVRDLTVARRYIMQKLAVGMLNIID